MHEYASFNHQIFSPTKISLPAFSSAAFYGKGVFTTVAIYNSNPLFWGYHWKRLTDNAAKLGINISEYSEESIKKTLSELIEANEITDARARLTFFDESLDGIWKANKPAKTSFLIITTDFRELGDSFSLAISPYRINSISPLTGIKSCNYLENLLAFQEAGKRGFSEALRLNEKDKVVSGCLCNIFWTKNGSIFTPALENGALCGTTREFITSNFTVYETASGIEELKDAESIFLTSAGIGIMDVRVFEGKTYGKSPVFEQVKQSFQLVTGKAE